MEIKCSKEMYKAISQSTLEEELRRYNIIVTFVVSDKFHPMEFNIFYEKDEIDYSDLIDALQQTEDYEQIEKTIDKYNEDEDCTFWFDYISLKDFPL